MKIEDSYPKRIVCLTEECTETLYLLNEESRIVGFGDQINATILTPSMKGDKRLVLLGQIRDFQIHEGRKKRFHD